MFDIKGKYGTALIHTDLIDNETIKEITQLVNQEFISNSNIAIMPDCHAGKGCVVGTTIQIKDKVVPNLVGVDIGCGMFMVKLGQIDIDYASLDHFIRTNIPFGHSVNDIAIDDSVDLSKLNCYSDIKDKGYILKSAGSLGGGNHFIEIDEDENHFKYLIIHSGSRYLGKQVCEIYQKHAIQYQKDKVFDIKKEQERIIKEYKKLGKQKELSKKLKSLKGKIIKTPMPEELCYLEGELFDQYIQDMDFCQRFAVKNRYLMAKKIVSFLNLNIDNLDQLECIHNYIDMEDMILRKGAISAYKDEIVIIPINMRDGCIIGRGKGNPLYNYSAPHGAGRILSRSEANEQLDLKEYINTMSGIYTTSVNRSTLDESPMAYKPIESIVENIADTVEIIKILKPTYNFKAS